MKTRFAWCLAAGAALLLGCDSGSGLRTMGMLGVPSPALIGANLVLVSAALNGHGGGRLLVDTGSPYTFVDPVQFPGATLPPQQQRVSVDIGVGALTIDAVPSIQMTTGAMNALHLGGILGANVLRQFSSQLNYRDQDLRLGDGPPPANVADPGSSVPFKLEGGSTSTSASVIPAPTTRVPVTVTIEGTDHPFVVDTGASEVTIRASLFDALTADGRARLGGLPIQTVYGSETGEVSRARDITVAGESVPDVVLLTLHDDSLLDGLASEVGHPVDGLLGGSYLREFLITIDYPHGMLHLQRYATRDHIQDEFTRVGIQIGATSAINSYAIGVVYAGSDAAAKGLRVGDVVLSIDGQALSAFNPIAADNLLQGTAGGTRRIGLGATTIPSLANTVVTVLIEDLVPAPS